MRRTIEEPEAGVEMLWEGVSQIPLSQIMELIPAAGLAAHSQLSGKTAFFLQEDSFTFAPYM